MECPAPGDTPIKKGRGMLNMTLRGECGMFELVPHMEDKNFQATTIIHVQPGSWYLTPVLFSWNPRGGSAIMNDSSGRPKFLYTEQTL